MKAFVIGIFLFANACILISLLALAGLGISSNRQENSYQATIKAIQATNSQIAVWISDTATARAVSPTPSARPN